MIGQALGILWQLAAIAFLALVILTVHKAKARGRRKFRDEPTARVRRLHPTTDHSKDIL